MVNKLVKRGLSAFVSKQTNIFSAALFIILTTIFGQFLGIVKYRLLVSIFGASPDLGIFFAAFRIPDFLFQVVLAGALATSLIPLFSEYISKDKKEEAFAFTSTIISIGSLIFIGVSFFVIILAPYLARLSAPGFTPQDIALMTQLMRLIQLAQIFFLLGIIMTAVLQSYQHFLIPGIAFSTYNLGIIIGVVLLTPFIGIYGAAIGVIIGAILFCAVQLPLLRISGFRFKPNLKFTDGVKKLFRLMIPRSLTLILAQLSLLASLFFASFISPRSYVIYELAQTLALAPVLLFGQSIAQASFPALSLKHDKKDEFLAIFTTSLSQILYLTLPVSALLIVLRIPVVRLFFGAPKLDWPATVDTGLTLAYFSVSITAQSLIYLFSRAFFAFKDTKTPFYATLASVVLNILLSYIFVLVLKWPIYSLAFSYSLATIFSIVLLTILIDKKIHLPKLDLAASGLKIVIATIVMGVSLYVPIKLLDQLVFDTTRTINLIILTGIASCAGFASYIFFTWLLDIKEAYYVIAVFKKFGNRRQMLKQIGEILNGPSQNP